MANEMRWQEECAKYKYPCCIGQMDVIIFIFSNPIPARFLHLINVVYIHVREFPFMATPSSIPASADVRAGPLSLRRVAIGTVLVMLVILGFFLLLELRDVIVAIFLGILLATALRPVMGGLRRIRLSRHLAAFGAVFLLLALVVGVTVAVFPTFVTQGQRLIQQLPSFYTSARDGLIHSRYQIVRQFGTTLQPSVSIQPSLLVENAIAQSSALASRIAQSLFMVLSIFLFTYYWLVYRERSIRGLLFLLPEERREATESLWLQIEDKIGAFIRGQVLLGVAVGLLSLLGYWLVGMPFTLLLGLMAGLLELIPYLGPIITAVFAAAVGFTVSPTMGLFAIGVAAVVQQLENALLVPRIMGSTVGVSPVVTLLAITGFGALFGLSGAFLAIPLAAVLQVLFDYWVQRSQNTAAEEGVQGRGTFALLRYQLLDLVQDVRNRLRNKEEVMEEGVDEPEEDLELLLADLDQLLTQLEQEPA